MRIIFVRHGHPDYENDCLTPIGHLHADAAAKRLEEEKIHQIFSSSCGRAMETAAHIAAPRKMEITPLDFMREIGWGSADGEPIAHNGHPWFTAFEMVAKGQKVMDEDFANILPFSRNKVLSHINRVVDGLDEWLLSLGLKREGHYYRICQKNQKNILLASHGGSSSAAFAHLLNIPFSFFCASVCPEFCAITILSFEGEEGDLITPKVEIMNDGRHIAEISVENVIDH